MLGRKLLFMALASLMPVLSIARTYEKPVSIDLYARSAVLMDAASGRVLYEKDGEEKLPNASTTKIMTCILALENGNLEDVLEVSTYAASMPKVHLGMRTGERYLLKDLLYSMMLESHNDSAVVIAEHIGGSVEQFAEMMNQKAKDIGCFDTCFITPNGLDASAAIKDGEDMHIKKHTTTAKDLARMLSYCILYSPQKDKFLEITRTANYCFSNIEMNAKGEYSVGNRVFSCTNHNAFLGMMQGVLSGKTGFTNNAGYCYVGALENENRVFTVALLACGWPNNRSYKWTDAKQLMQYGIENYSYASFSDIEIPQKLLQPIPVLCGQTEHIGQTAAVPIYMEETHGQQQHIEGLLLNEEESIELNCQIVKRLTAPVRKGEVVGNIQFTTNGIVWKTICLKTEAAICEIDFMWCLHQTLNCFFKF